MADNLTQEVKELLAELTGLDAADIGETDDIIEDLGIDSLKVIEIATRVERAYKVTLKDSDLMKLRKVKDAVEFLRGLLEKRNA